MSDETRLAYLRQLCELMHEQGAFELSCDGIHIALSPKTQPASSADATTEPRVQPKIGEMSDEEIIRIMHLATAEAYGIPAGPAPDPETMAPPSAPEPN